MNSKNPAKSLLPLLLALPACSLIIDTNPDGVIYTGGAAGRSGGSSGKTSTTAVGGVIDAGGRAAGSGGSGTAAAGNSTTQNPGGGASVGGAGPSGAGTASGGLGLGGATTSIPTAGAPSGGVATASGGAPALGGAIPTIGGGSPIAGTTANGGTPNAGGKATGGVTGIGGSGGSAVGGTPASGGAIAGAAGATACSPGTMTCSGNIPQLCTNSRVWQDQTVCSGSTPICSGGNCICSSGSQQCKTDGVTPQYCNASGAWQDQTACTGATPICNGEGICGVCKAKERKCDKATPNVCADDGSSWVAQTACSGVTPFCAAGSCTATCPGNGGPTMKLLPEGYCIDTTEVTREQYYNWIVTNPVASPATQIANCSWNTSFVPGADTFNSWPPTGNFQAPVVNIDWCDAYGYCAAVGKRLCGKIGGGSLDFVGENAAPLTSQWINACSAHGTYDYTFGNTYDATACNGFDAGVGSVEYVASRSKCQSPLSTYAGVYDLSGNVREWEDSCEPSTGMSGRCQVRGGAYDFWDTALMCNSPFNVDKIGVSADIGFRCCTQ